MLKTPKLAARLLWREIKAGEWIIVFFSLLIATIVITSLHLYTDRLKQGLNQQAAKFLGGNVAIVSSSPISPDWIIKAKSLKLRTAELWSYPSVISAQDKLQLVNIRAVSSTYPLMGQARRPSAQSVWLEPRLFALFSIHENSVVTIGDATFNVEGSTENEISALNLGWLIAPQMMMRLEDVPSTHTIIPGSQVEYRLLLMGTEEQLSAFRDWVVPKLSVRQRLVDIQDQQFIFYKTIERTQNFLQLALIACLILVAVSITLSVQHYIRRHLLHVSLWRCFGAKTQQIIKIYLYQLFFVGLAAGLVGIGVSLFVQIKLDQAFSHFFQFTLPATTITPLFIGFFANLLLLFAFSYPLISELPRVSPLYLWRQEVKTGTTRQTFYFIFAALAVIIAFYWLLKLSLVSLFFLNGLLICVNLSYLLSLLFLNLVKRLSYFCNGSIKRGLNQLLQLSNSVSLQVTAFTLIFMSVFILIFIKNDLIKNWRDSLPATTPNYFAINIAPTDLENLKNFFQKQQVIIQGIYPMTKGRLIGLNGKPILSAIPKSGLGNNALWRELNLSWMWQYPEDNKIISGESWTAADKNKAYLSVEKKLADDLDLQLGDDLTFQLEDKQITAKITNIRAVEWTSFHPNFYIIFIPGLLDNFIATYITSFHLTSDRKNILNQLVAQFPNITIIDIATIVKQAGELIGKITIIIQYMVFFTFMIGVLILVTSIQAGMDERRKTYQLLRILGASNQYIRHSVIVEFGFLFASILLMSYVLSQVMAVLLEKKIFGV